MKFNQDLCKNFWYDLNKLFGSKPDIDVPTFNVLGPNNPLFALPAIGQMGPSDDEDGEIEEML